MTTGFELSQGKQTGTFNLNDREISFEIGYNETSDLFYIDLLEDGEYLIAGKFLTNGIDLLFGKEYLNLGSSLIYLGENDMSIAYLQYEV